MKKKNHEWLNCSEEQLKSRIAEWVKESPETFKNMILFLVGEMGSGKSTFARHLLEALVPHFNSRGSPTFPIIQEYTSKSGFPIYHIDLYRLKNENELENAGILQQIEEPGSLALVEWPDLFPEVFQFWNGASQNRRKKVIQVKIERLDSGLRNFTLHY